MYLQKKNTYIYVVRTFLTPRVNTIRTIPSVLPIEQIIFLKLRSLGAKRRRSSRLLGSIRSQGRRGWLSSCTQGMIVNGRCNWKILGAPPFNSPSCLFAISCQAAASYCKNPALQSLSLPLSFSLYPPP